MTFLVLTSIILLPASALPATILLTATQIVSSMMTMPHQMKSENENPGKHHDDYGNEEIGLGENEYFNGFDENEYVTSKDD